MTNITFSPKKQALTNNTPVDKLLAHLFADKKAIYIDDINFSADGGYDVSWCLDFTLKMSRPQWMDTHLERQPLISYILAEKLNQWEAYRYCNQSGSVQPCTETCADIETFLDENYQEVIHKFLENSI